MAQTPPGQGGSAASQKWWVVYTTVSQSIHPAPTQGNTAFQIVQAVNKSVASANVSRQGLIVTKVQGPFDTKHDAGQAAAGVSTANKKAVPKGSQLDLNPLNWLSSAGGLIGSGIEAGFVDLLKDIWNVILGPIQVLAGILVLTFTLIYLFKNDIAQAGMLVALAAA
jgi:hypothetical protein